MSERRKPYPFDQIEPKWQAIWDERQVFRALNPGEKGFDSTKPKFYVLDMFPYPSGTGLHVGHPEGYTATDIVSRYRRLRGFNVLHPMGWDAFGLPAEQYAIKTGQHPAVTTRENVAKFKAQLKRIGFSYDWQREVNTTDPRYYKWTQWIFLKIYNSYFDEELGKARPISKLLDKMKSWRSYGQWSPEVREKIVNDRRLAYVADDPVWFCPELGTVLAAEEVINGRSEVGGYPVVRRPMRQWLLRITKYADRLIDDLDGLDWPVSIKLLQSNWIGRSDGAIVSFDHEYSDSAGTLMTLHFHVFTTRPDTIFGATYLVLAPEHAFVDQITTEDQRSGVQAYRSLVASRSDLVRTNLAKEKTGVFTGGYVINPLTGDKIPVWIADYVVMKRAREQNPDDEADTYPLGAVMGVPAHDDRDWEFTALVLKDPEMIRVVVDSADQRFCNWLPIKLSPAAMDGIYGKPSNVQIRESPNGGQWLDFPNRQSAEKFFAEHQYDVGAIVPSPSVAEGTAINSQNSRVALDGLPTSRAKEKIIDFIDQQKLGHRSRNYKLDDWLFSRQRYWGEPFPIVWKEGKHHALAESELPVVPPPLDDFKPTGTGEPPLAKAKDWVRYSEKAVRETNTMPQWAGSCWYYLRFCDPQNDQRFVGEEAERYWMGGPKPGGVDLYVGGTEHAVLHLLYARFWHKVLNDLDLVSKKEPFQRLVNQGIILGEDNQKMSKSRGNVISPDDVIESYGADAFRCYEMFMGPLEQMKPWSMRGVEGVARFLARVWRLMMTENQAGDWELSAAVKEIEPDKAQQKITHATIKKVTHDIETLSFNTAISQMMIFVNAFIPQRGTEAIPLAAMRTFLVLLNPFAPHLSSELWEKLNARFQDFRGDIAEQAWPGYDEKLLIEDEVEMPIQVDGKVRDRTRLPINAPREEIEKAVHASVKVQGVVGKGEIGKAKIIIIPNKLINVVTLKPGRDKKK